MSTTSANTAWTLAYGDETMRVDGVLTGVGARTRGESYTYSCVFRDATRGAEDRSAIECFNDILSLGEYAGRFDLHEMLDGPPEYTPRWPDGSPSLLIHLEPVDSDAVPVPGIWGLLESVDVATAPISGAELEGQSPTVDLSITHLADGPEYLIPGDLRDDLANPGLY